MVEPTSEDPPGTAVSELPSGPTGAPLPPSQPVAEGRPAAPESLAKDARDSSLWRWRGPISLVGGVLFAILGLLVVTAKLAHGGDEALANARPAELVQILDSVESDIARLNAEKRTLQAEIEALRSGTTAEAVTKARARLEAQQILAGTTPVRGPGIRMVITDRNGGIDSGMVLDLVAELRDAGAESIEFADRRVVLNTWFGDTADTADPGIIVSGDLRKSPFVVQAIGNADTLATAMGIPGGVADTVRDAGATFELQKRPNISINSTVTATAPQYAKPAG